MNILFLCHKMPYPPIDGGAIASLNMITEFANQGHSVHVIAMQTPKHSFSVTNLPDQLKQTINWKQVSINTNISPFKALINLLFSTKPYNAQRFISTQYKATLLNLLAQNKFDIIQLEGLYLTPYINTIRKNNKSIIALRAHNIEWLIWDRLAQNEKSILKSFYYNILAKRLKHMEHMALNKVDLLIPITETDKKGLPFKNQTKVFVSPTGIINKNILKQNAPDSKTLFYIGALDWLPNQEGLLWFIEKVWLKLKSKFPDWDFIIAGRNAPETFKNILDTHPVKYIGEVKSASNFIDQHKIMIVPLLAGSGMRIKIIEGMARSKCIVTTTIGAEGILVSENSIIIADYADQMASLISYLIENNQIVNDIGIEAYNFIIDNFNNTKLIRQLSDFYQKNLQQ